MTTIHEFQQILWVDTPHGKGMALLMIDYGAHENTIWVVALEQTGIIKHYNSNDIKLCINHTFSMNLKNKIKNKKNYGEGLH
jgi:hypothetical protein